MLEKNSISTAALFLGGSIVFVPHERRPPVLIRQAAVDRDGTAGAPGVLGAASPGRAVRADARIGDDREVRVVGVRGSVGGVSDRATTPLVVSPYCKIIRASNKDSSVPGVVPSTRVKRGDGRVDWYGSITSAIGLPDFSSRSPAGRVRDIVAVTSTPTRDIGHALTSLTTITTSAVSAVKRRGRGCLVNTHSLIGYLTCVAFCACGARCGRCSVDEGSSSPAIPSSVVKEEELVLDSIQSAYIFLSLRREAVTNVT